MVSILPILILQIKSNNLKVSMSFLNLVLPTLERFNNSINNNNMLVFQENQIWLPKTIILNLKYLLIIWMFKTCILNSSTTTPKSNKNWDARIHNKGQKLHKVPNMNHNQNTKMENQASTSWNCSFKKWWTSERKLTQVELLNQKWAPK